MSAQSMSWDRIALKQLTWSIGSIIHEQRRIYLIDYKWLIRLIRTKKKKNKNSIRSKIQFSYGAFLQINQKEVMILKDVKVYQFKVHVLKKDIEKEIKLNIL